MYEKTAYGDDWDNEDQFPEEEPEKKSPFKTFVKRALIGVGIMYAGLIGLNYLRYTGDNVNTPELTRKCTLDNDVDPFTAATCIERTPGKDEIYKEGKTIRFAPNKYSETGCYFRAYVDGGRFEELDGKVDAIKIEVYPDTNNIEDLIGYFGDQVSFQDTFSTDPKTIYLSREQYGTNLSEEFKNGDRILDFKRRGLENN
jgi:hypothetical protein